MSVRLNGTIYKLCLLDTGIISEIVKDRGLRSFLGKLLVENYLPSISIWSVLEVRQRDDIYSGFLDLFSIVPFVMLKDSYNVFFKELEFYPNPNRITPIAFAFSMLNKDPNAHLKPFMQKLFSHPEILKSESAWNTGWKNDSLEMMLSLKSNFKPRKTTYNASDAKRFIEIGIPQYVTAFAPDWVQSENFNFDPNAFRSVKMAFYTVFYRFYGEQRSPEEQDVFDILIGNIASYVDRLITEKFQAEIFRKVKNQDSFLEHLEIGTLNDLR